MYVMYIYIYIIYIYIYKKHIVPLNIMYNWLSKYVQNIGWSNMAIDNIGKALSIQKNCVYYIA